MTKSHRVVITDYQFPSIETEKQIIEAAGGEIEAFQCTSQAEIIAACSDADGLLVQWAPISRTVLENLRNCKIIVRYGIGLDNIDLDAAKDCGIAVRNVPDYCVDEVADHTLALAMSLARQIPVIDRQIRKGIWKIIPPRPMLASRQSTFVTVGFGRIARAVLHRARAFGFQLATCDPYLPEDFKLPEDIRRVSLEDALRTADILSLNLPLTQETRHIINLAAISRMKPTSIVVNTARGGLIDTVALASALEAGTIAGAALDVFEREPLEDDHPLRRCSNALLTSHVSWYSELSGQTLQAMAAHEIVRHLPRSS